MKILYLHGFGSRFDPSSDKVTALRKIGEVLGYDIDYSRPPATVIDKAMDAIEFFNPDLIVGTSMGAWLASKVADTYGIPFVAINPCMNPAASLMKYCGEPFVDYTGKKIKMESTYVERFEPFTVAGCALVLLDEGDELFSSAATKNTLDPYFDVRTFAGGCHRFDHMEESIDIINNFYNTSEVVYGVS